MKTTKVLASALVLLMGTSALAQAGSLSFVSESESLTKDCPVKIDVMIDTEGEDVNSVDFALLKNDSFVLNEVDSTDGVFRTYTQPKEKVANEKDYKGQEFVSLLATTASPNGFNGEGKFLTLTVTPTADMADLQIYMIPGGNGEDSNLAVKKGDDVVDVLSSAEPMSYTVVEGECNVAALEAINFEDTEEPVVTAAVVEDVVEDTTDLNEANVFDETQEGSFLAQNWMYLAIAIVVVIIVLVVALKPKKKK